MNNRGRPAFAKPVSFGDPRDRASDWEQERSNTIMAPHNMRDAEYTFDVAIQLFIEKNGRRLTGGLTQGEWVHIQNSAGARPVEGLPVGGGSESLGSSWAGQVRFVFGPGTTKSLQA
jgi:hypothetical protein